MESPGEIVVFVAMAPALLAFDRSPGFVSALAAGLVFAELFAFSVFSWFAVAMATYASLPVWIGYAALFVLAPILEPQFVVVPLVRRALAYRGARPLRVAVSSALLYVGVEWLAPKLFGDSLGLALHPSPLLRQGADIAGVAGLTIVVWLVNEALAVSLRRVLARRGTSAGRSMQLSDRRSGSLRWKSAGEVAPPLAAAGLLVALLAGYGFLRLASLREAGEGAPRIRVALVQGDLSRYGQLAASFGTYEATRGILDVYFTLTADLLASEPVDLVVWPETVYPTTFGSPKSEAGAEFDRELARFVSASGVPLIFGAYDGELGREYNAAFVLEPEGSSRAAFDVYRKAALFPMTERVPRWLDRPGVRRVLPWLGSWSPGTGAATFAVDLRDGRRIEVAPLVCYDAVDPDLARRAVRDGAELFLTLSNDSWFAEGGGPQLHLVVSAFRSIETRRPQARATNTGISAGISATGEIAPVVPVHAREARVASLALASGETPYVRFGHRLGPLALAMGLLVLLGSLRGFPRAARRGASGLPGRGIRRPPTRCASRQRLVESAEEEIR
jgi:apolipoprotein N-acyltransferase